ncbi:hypothetical protein HF325_006184 [Metschnikowia pulcherrima]|uniref:Uncharacterized protein n=1 Tax=Metschnikowia pulcherrima TaxID=27326 RepID=A0A8H7GLY9_9ASCO|nr:hypothetical protein HF325_006184 [Metschnikowia pulcherrima]
MHLNFVLTPVNASSIISRKLKWVVKDVKNVNSRKRHESRMGSQTTKDGLLEHNYNKCKTTSIWWQQIGPESPMHLNSILAPVNASSENLRKLNGFVKIVKKSVLFKTARITGWARIADPSFARVKLAGGRSIAIRAMTS